MKRITAIILSAFLFGILFFKQGVGLNFVVFNASILVLLFARYKEGIKNPTVIFLVICAIITSISAFYYGNYLSAYANILTLISLPGVLEYQRNPLVLNAFLTGYSMIFTPINQILERLKQKSEIKKENYIRLLPFGVPVIFILIFFFIYRSISPLFEKLTQNMILDFISFEFFLFLILGLFLANGLFHPTRILGLDTWEQSQTNAINKSTVKSPFWSENSAFVVLFIVLNVMLVAVNLLDVNYLYLGEEMPKDITHKQFVHKGVNMFILSIVLGISILVYFFRGSLNFSPKAKLNKFLACFWVFQNLFMLLSTYLRNTMYVNEALLTYKRIGVYVWLLLALIGLVVLLIKLLKSKTTWFMGSP